MVLKGGWTRSCILRHGVESTGEAFSLLSRMHRLAAFGLYFKLLGEAAFVRRLRMIVLRSENEHIFYSYCLTHDLINVTYTL